MKRSALDIFSISLCNPRTKRFGDPGLHYQLHTSISRSRIGQDPRLSLHARKFCGPTSGVGVSEQSHHSVSIERVLVYIKSV